MGRSNTTPHDINWILNEDATVVANECRQLMKKSTSPCIVGTWKAGIRMADRELK